MNRVYLMGAKTPLQPFQLAAQANAILSRKVFTSFDFMGEESRVAGAGHCECSGNGEFELLPANHPMVIEGGKRYMVCRNCGCYSHL